MCVDKLAGLQLKGDSDDQGLEHPMFKEGPTEQVCLVQKRKRQGRPFYTGGNDDWVKGNVFLMRLAKHLCRLPREIVKSQSLEML